MPNYRMPEAAKMLDVSESLLRRWIAKARLREAIKRQRLDYDLRVFYLTSEQLEQIASAHGRQIALPGETDTAARLEALEANYEDYEERISALERAMQREGIPLTGPQQAIKPAPDTSRDQP